MEYCGGGEEKRRELLLTVINFSFQQGWIPENERLQIETKRTTSEMEMALFKLMKKMRNFKMASKLLCAIKCSDEVHLSPNSVYNELGLQSAIMSKLLEKSLITEEEKIAFERELQNKITILPKACSSASSYCTPHEVKGRSVFEMEVNPLEVPPVIRCLLQHLNIQDIINLRLVSKEWSSVGLGVLTTRSVDFFLPGKLSKFYQIFSNSIGFKNITLSEPPNEKPWLISELNEFFERQGRHITKLKLNKVQLVDSDLKKVPTLRLTPWLSNCAMTNQNTENITKLTVICDTLTTSFSVDVSSFTCLKKLSLRNVRVNIQNGIQISLIKLKLYYVSFFKDGIYLTYFHLNQIFDFSNTKHISLVSLANQSNTNLYLTLHRSGKLDHLELTNATLTNFETCRWEINQLIVFNVRFIERTQMQIKELVVQSCQLLNISNIPRCIEKLSFKDISADTFWVCEDLSFENIKFLDLNFNENVFSIFDLYLTFPNLTHLHLRNSYAAYLSMNLDISWIPKTLKVMSLSKIQIWNSKSQSVNVEKLILTPSQPLKIKEFCASYVRTKEFVLDFAWRCEKSDWKSNMQQIADVLEHQIKCGKCFQRFYVGNLSWGINKFDLFCPLYYITDKKADYYQFDNQKGKAIEDDEFRSHIDLDAMYSRIK